MKKSIFVVGGILIAAGAAAGIGWYYYNGSGIGLSDDSAVYVSSVSTITGAVQGVYNRYAGVVEPQETVEVNIEGSRKVKAVNVKTGEEVKKGQLLFEYDLSSIQEDLQQAQLDLDRLKNEALSLTDQIATLEKEKKQATTDNQLSYTIEIETNKMNLKKNEYDQISKEAEIEKLQNATGNTEVRSEIDGIIQKIDTSKMSTDDGDVLDEGYSDDDYYSDSSSSDAFITILSTGAYRVKGQVNELEAQSFLEGDPIIVHSRLDETQVWRGTLSSVDRENAVSSSSSSYWGMSDTDSQTSSSSYPFYVELEDSDGLMLGQHVYIERDLGQEDQKDGLWLSEFYIVDADQEDPYVWAVGSNDRLEKRTVILGNYDSELGEYEIVDGLTLKDYIAFPADDLEEGRPTTTNLADLEDTSGEDDLYLPDSTEEPLTMEDYDMDDTDILEDWDDTEDWDVEDTEEWYTEDDESYDEISFEDDLTPLDGEEDETWYEEEDEVTIDDAEDLK